MSGFPAGSAARYKLSLVRKTAIGAALLGFSALATHAWVASPATATTATIETAARPHESRPVPRPSDEFVRPHGATVELFAPVAAGDGIKQLLERAGVQERDAEAASELVAEALPAGPAEGTELGILLGGSASGPARRLERLSFKSGLAFKITVGRTRNGELKLARDAVNVDAKPRSFSGNVGAGLFWSMRAAGVPAQAAAEFQQAAGKRIDLRGLTPNDRFELVIDHVRSESGETRAGPVLYGSLQRQAGRGLTLVRWNVGGQTDLFDPYSTEQQGNAFARPVQARISSRFGYRIHPILRFARFHQGVDFEARWSTPVIAAADGFVRAAGWAGAYGRQVQLGHSGGLLTSYSHLSQLAVVPGMQLRKGDVIGYVGSSGLSTGPHLHFEVRRNGHPVDPLTFNFASGQLTATDRIALRARADQLRGV